MDTRVPADEGGWPPPAAAGAGADPLEQRLAAIEHRLDSLERTVRDTVTEELHLAGDELRRAISDLGRMFLRDLDRLTKVLAEHRDAIVDRVTSAVIPVVGQTPPAPATADAGPSEADADSEAESAGGDGGGGGEGGADEGRWRRKARRSSKTDGGDETRAE